MIKFVKIFMLDFVLNFYLSLVVKVNMIILIVF